MLLDVSGKAELVTGEDSVVVGIVTELIMFVIPPVVVVGSGPGCGSGVEVGAIAVVNPPSLHCPGVSATSPHLFSAA